MSKIENIDARIVAFIKSNLSTKKRFVTLSKEIAEIFKQAVEPDMVHRIKQALREQELCGAPKRSLADFYKAAKDKKPRRTRGFDDEHGDFSFKPRAVTSMVAGRTYFFTGIGFLEYRGEQTVKVLENNLDVYVFSSAGSSDGDQVRALRSFPKKRFQDLEIRELATPEDMEKLIRKLELGTCRTNLAFLSRRISENDRKASKEKCLLSGDLSVLADVSCARFRDGNKLSSLAVPSDTALSLLATEYSLVMDCGYDESLSLMRKKSGRNDFMEKIHNSYNKKGGEVSVEAPLAP